jgi:vitamin B12 transporter
VFATYSFMDGRATLHADAKFNGPQRDLAFDANFNSVRIDLPGYALVNVAASFKFNEHVEVYGRIENVLNTRYQQVFSYGNPGLGAFAGLRVKLDYKP